MSELICNLQSGKDPMHIPAWALDYLLTQPLRDILHSAAFRNEHDVVPIDAETCALPRLDIKRILLRRWIELDHKIIRGHRIILSLYLSKSGSVVPFIMVDAEYFPKNSCTKLCIIEGQWPHQVSEETNAIHDICTKCVFDRESGKRLHLRPHSSNVRLSHHCPAFVGLETYERQVACHVHQEAA